MRHLQIGVERSSNLRKAMGIFQCQNITSPWSVSIEPVDTRINIPQDLQFVTLKTSVISNEAAVSTANKDTANKAREIQQQQQRVEQARQKRVNEKLAYENAKKFNIPTKNDIGQTICKDSELSEHTGYIVMGRNTYNKVQGVVVASLEDFSTNGSNLKINIKGWLSDRNQIGSGSNVLYKQTPLESGRVIWDNKQGWFKCNY